MSTGIIYLLTNAQLGARLVVSLYSLRQFYGGPITVFTTRPESHEIAQRCTADPRLRVRHETTRERPGKGYHSSYLTKAAILNQSPYEHAVFLDADTLVVGDISELMRAASSSTVTATAFCGFITTEEPTKGIIEEWRRIRVRGQVKTALHKLIDRAVEIPFLAINAGVFGFRAGTRLLKEWDRLTLIGRHMRTPEEIALQLLLPDYDHHLLGHHFNCHPYVPIDKATVRIWHFAACTHLQKPHGAPIWLPAYRHCRDLGVAGISEWSRIDNMD